MIDIVLSDSAKAQVFNAVCSAELDFLAVVQQNARAEAMGDITTRGNCLRERQCRAIYAALYRLCCNLRLEESYNEWRESPIYEEGEDESTYTSEQDDAQRD